MKIVQLRKINKKNPLPINIYLEIKMKKMAGLQTLKKILPPLVKEGGEEKANKKKKIVSLKELRRTQF